MSSQDRDEDMKRHITEPSSHGASKTDPVFLFKSWHWWREFPEDTKSGHIASSGYQTIPAWTAMISQTYCNNTKQWNSEPKLWLKYIQYNSSKNVYCVSVSTPWSSSSVPGSPLNTKPTSSTFNNHKHYSFSLPTEFRRDCLSLNVPPFRDGIGKNTLFALTDSKYLLYIHAPTNRCRSRTGFKLVPWD